MIIATMPENETKRLETLKNLNLLDTPIEERFERITRVLARALNVPITAISLIDESRQWFKSVQGLTVSETTRDSAFCAHTILDKDMMVINDATKDPRFCNNPLVTGEPNIRFYAGQAIYVDDFAVGTLCAIDSKPREITDLERDILRDLARMVEIELVSIALSKEQRKHIGSLDKREIEARVDPLTRLWNRKGIVNLLQRDWDFAIRHNFPISMIMASLDNHRDIKIKFGNTTSDDIIKHVAVSLLSSLRSYDVAGRWTNDSFVIVIPGCNKKGVTSILKSHKARRKSYPHHYRERTRKTGIKLWCIKPHPHQRQYARRFYKIYR